MKNSINEETESNIFKRFAQYAKNTISGGTQTNQTTPTQTQQSNTTTSTPATTGASNQSAATTASKQATGTSAEKGGGRVQPKQGLIDARRATYGKMMMALKAAGITDEAQQKQYAEQIITNIIIPFLTVHLNARGINVTDLRSKKSSLSKNSIKDATGKPKVVTISEDLNLLSERRLEITKKEKGSKIQYLDQAPEIKSLADQLANGDIKLFRKENDIARKYGNKLDSFIISKNNNGEIRVYDRSAKEEAQSWMNTSVSEKKPESPGNDSAPTSTEPEKRKGVAPVKRPTSFASTTSETPDVPKSEPTSPTTDSAPSKPVTAPPTPPPELVPPTPEAKSIVTQKIDINQPIPLFTGNASLLQRINTSIKSRAKIDVNKPGVQDQFKQIIKDLVDQLKINGLTNKQIQENFNFCDSLLNESTTNRWKILANIK